MVIRIGTSGWSYDHWHPELYPPGLAAGGRLARSVPDARAIGDDLAARGIKLSLGGQVYDPEDPMGKLFFNILAIFAEFEAGLLRMRTREGMAVARAKGKLRGKQPKLSARQQRELARMAGTGEYTITTSPRCSPSPARPCTGLSSEPGCGQGQVTSPSRYLAPR